MSHSTVQVCHLYAVENVVCEVCRDLTCHFPAGSSESYWGVILLLQCNICARTGDSEELVAADSVNSAIQHMVGDGGQRVITIVTDQHGNLQTGGLGQQFFVTMQHGQQSESLSLRAVGRAA